MSHLHVVQRPSLDIVSWTCVDLTLFYLNSDLTHVLSASRCKYHPTKIVNVCSFKADQTSKNSEILIPWYTAQGSSYRCITAKPSALVQHILLYRSGSVKFDCTAHSAQHTVSLIHAPLSRFVGSGNRDLSKRCKTAQVYNNEYTSYLVSDSHCPSHLESRRSLAPVSL